LLKTSLQNHEKNKVTSTPALATQMALPANQDVLLHKPLNRQADYFRTHGQLRGSMH